MSRTIHIVCPRCKGYGTVLNVLGGVGKFETCGDCSGNGSFEFVSEDVRPAYGEDIQDEDQDAIDTNAQ